jgi:hypothetical protein
VPRIGISNGLVAGQPMPANAGPEGLEGLELAELAELAPGLLPWPDSAGSRRFAWSSFGVDIGVDPGLVGIETTCGAASP